MKLHLRRKAPFRRALPAMLALVVAQSLLAPGIGSSATTVASVRDGKWTSPSTWQGGRVPTAVDIVEVRHEVTLSANASVAGLNIARRASLTFPARASRTLSSEGNVVVKGTLRMRPASAARVHRLIFPNIVETNFQGGGHSPLATDVGLWVRPSGRLDLAGAAKTPWTRATRSIPARSTSFTVASARGWRAGDEIVLGPTQPDERREAFEVLRISNVDVESGRVSLESPTSRPHVEVRLPNGAVMRPEVLNLSRNVRIEGTASGRSHIHIYGARKQTVRYVALRHMGVPIGERTSTGRYALHFHHGHDRSRGTVVHGVVARNVGTHAFVPHESHGITFRRTIAYDFEDAAYWWDRLEGDERVSLTHDTHLQRCVAANGVSAGIMHQFGARNSMVGCVAYGIDPTVNGVPGRGFAWDGVPTNQEPFRPQHAVWVWRDGIAHNTATPIWTWQNTGQAHDVIRPVSYWPAPAGGRISNGLLHGAYSNVYHYIDGVILGDRPFALHAASGTSATDSRRRQEHRNMIYDAANGPNAMIITQHNLAGETSGLISRCTLRGYTDAAVRVNENTSNQFSRGGDYTFRDCVTGDGSALEPADFDIVDLHQESEICIENESDAWRIDGRGSVYTVVPVPSCP